MTPLQQQRVEELQTRAARLTGANISPAESGRQIILAMVTLYRWIADDSEQLERRLNTQIGGFGSR